MSNATFTNMRSAQIKRYAPTLKSSSKTDAEKKASESSPPKATVVHPAEETEEKGEVKLSNLTIDTPEEDLEFSEDFNASVDVEIVKPSKYRRVFVNVFAEYKGVEEDVSKSAVEFFLDEASMTASGKLKLYYHTDHAKDKEISEDDVVKYFLEAEHFDAAEKIKSEGVEISALESEKLWILELPDILFRLNSAIPILDEKGKLIDALAKAIQYAAENEDKELVVFGHTDKSGEVKHNYDLSMDRACSIQSILAKDPETWKAVAKTRGSVEDYQSLLAVLNSKYEWGCDPGEVDGLDGKITQGALKNFQRNANQLLGLKLKIDGKIGPNTWGAFHGVYVHLLIQQLGEEDYSVKFGYSEGNGVYACGESFPQPTPKEGTYQGDNDRRVELIFALPKAHKFLQAPGDTSQLIKAGDCYYAKASKIVVSPDAHPDMEIVSDFAYNHFRGLAGKLAEGDFIAWCYRIFGLDLAKETIQKMREDLLSESLVRPSYLISDEGLDGKVAGYDRVEQRVVVSPELVKLALNSQVKRWELMAALVEEFGHHIDHILRNTYSTIGGDAELDEGAAFGHALIPFQFHLRDSMSFAEVTCNGKTQLMMVEWKEFKEVLDLYFSEAAQHADDKSEVMEYFGGEAHGLNSHGHRSIEKAFQNTLKYDEHEMAEIYFGNWTRDLSQVISPISLWPDKGLTRENLTHVVNFFVYSEFRWDHENHQLKTDPKVNHSAFELTPERLGIGRPEEHMDNPVGTEDTDKDDTFSDIKFREKCDENSPELQTDRATGIRKYIIGTNPGASRAKGDWISIRDYYKQELTAACREGKNAEGFRRLGNALHCLEDFYAHSNFVELCLRVNHAGVVTWCKAETVNGKTFFPLTTGAFGLLDNLASFGYLLHEKLSPKKEDDEEMEYGEYLLIANFLMEYWKTDWNENLRVYLKILLLILNDKPIEDDLPENCPPEIKDAVGVLDKIREITGFVDVKKILEYIKKAIDDQLKPHRDVQRLFLILPIYIFASRIDEFQTYQQEKSGKAGYPFIPTHSQLAKDHADHPLHLLASECAMFMSETVALKVDKYWRAKKSDPAEINSVVNTADEFIFHPDFVGEPSESQLAIYNKVENWCVNNQSLLNACTEAGGITGRQERMVFRAIEDLMKKAGQDWEELKKAWDKTSKGINKAGATFEEYLEKFKDVLG